MWPLRVVVMLIMFVGNTWSNFLRKGSVRRKKSSKQAGLFIQVQMLKKVKSLKTV